MPVYEYQCTECGNQFELRQSFSASTETTCPVCGKVSKRRISPVPVIFKGSGWYVTDYAQKSPTVSKPAEKDEAKTPPKSSDDAKSAPAASTASPSKSDAAKSDTKASTPAKASSSPAPANQKKD